MSTDEWVALLGVKGGPAIRPGSSMPTATLVRLGGRTVLVDAGLGAAAGTCAQGVALTGLDLIVVTHLHSDHYLELGPLLHTAWTAGLRRPVPVIGPPGLRRYWERFLSAMRFDVELRQADEGRPPLAPLAAVEEVAMEGDGPLVLRQGGCGDLRVTAIRNHHPPIRDSYALRLEAEGRAVVLSGDTAPIAAMPGFAAGADLLVHEAMLEDAVDDLLAAMPSPDPRLRAHILRSHTPAHEAGRIAAEAGVGALALHHFVPDGLHSCAPERWEAEVRRSWDGALHLGTDGMRILF